MTGFSGPSIIEPSLATLTHAHQPPRDPAIAKAFNFARMPALGSNSSLATWARAAAVAALYGAVMVACIMIGRYGAQVTPIWIPSAILAWVLITSPARDWPILVGFTALGHLLGAYVVGDQFDIEIIYLAANVASPLLLAALMRGKGNQLEFEDRAEVLRFLIYGGVFAPALSAAIALAPAALNGQFDSRFAAIWFFSESLSLVVFLPIFKIVASNGWRELMKPDIRVKAFALLGVLVVAHAISAFLPPNFYSIFTILLIPYLIYVAFDAGMTAARAAIALSAILMLCVGLLVLAQRVTDPQGMLLSLQVYLLATVACVMPIAAALEERARLYEAASESLHDAQEAWGQLIAAEAHYRLIADNMSDLVARLGADGTILFASPAWKELGADPNTMGGKELGALVHPDDLEQTRSSFYALVAAGALDAPRRWQVRLRDMNGVWRDYHVNATLVAPGSGAANEVVAVLRRVQEE